MNTGVTDAIWLLMLHHQLLIKVNKNKKVMNKYKVIGG